MQTRLVLIAGLFLAVNMASGVESDARFFGGGNDGCGGVLMHARSLDGGPQVSFWSTSAPRLVWTDAGASLTTVSIGVWDPKSAVTNGGMFKVCVPSAWQCRFDTNAAVAVGGAAVAKIGSPYYASDGRSLILPLQADFTAGDLVTVTGLKIIDLRLCRSGTQWLGLSFSNSGVADVYDECPQRTTVYWLGGSCDDWGIATSDPLGFYVPTGTMVSVQ